MAEAMLRRRLGPDGGRVTSAGTAARAGMPAAPPAVEAAAAFGALVGDHQSRPIGAGLLRAEGKDLVLAMTRDHLRELVVTDAAVWPRTFTLKEIVRRGQSAGPRLQGEAVADWLERVAKGRTTAELMGASTADDVADPYGLSASHYRTCAAEIDGLLAALTRLLGVEA